ncbi:MAG: glutamine synthetase type III, partial [Kiritimatiellae bacterium]|nr:glutamine synthetase type III [Kiritimatiellia bacterium]
RTLFGAAPPKHQQLEDHYFGAIRPRVAKFMEEVERELWRLGIPAKTRHNEVAPAQFELASVFEELNLAVDHNMLVMETLRQVAERNGLVCLLHEKPFAGVNGSGKHNNWSVAYGKRNLLDPGDDPEQNSIFLTVLCAVVRALDLHGDLLRTTTAGAGNDCRLGGNEAPPAVLSVFLGEQLGAIVAGLASGSGGAARKAGTLRVGVDTLPPLPRDTADRNRTSPFAFTGNKFEFRQPGSSQPCAAANMFLNVMVADSFDRFAGQLEAAGPEKFHDTLQALLRRVFRKHERVIFNGDGYSADWAAEAARRGLPNLRATPEAIAPLLDPDNQALVAKYGVLSKVEMESRHEVALEEYERKVGIEGGIALEIAKSMVRPVVLAGCDAAAAALQRAAATGTKPGAKGLKTLAATLGRGLDDLAARCTSLEKALAAGSAAKTLEAMAAVRETVDALEHEVDDAAWPLPKYREMLFLY